jgi:nucleoside-diphosphate-sugar epimerase
MKIAILGATSQIAQDLILSFSMNKDYDFLLFGRNVKLLKKWTNGENLNEKCRVHEYSDFDNHQKYDAIINFVGIGDPAKAQKMGSDIFKITERYDNMVLEYLKQHKKTKYIFLSSGAVYGGNYQEPVNENTVAMVDINNLNITDWYAIAKLYAEAKHRSLSDLSIVDIRVFNYFSHTQDMDARFLITDIVRAIKNQEVFKTSADNIVRDFITPPDFYNLIQAVIDFKPINTVLDCYTKSSVSKFDLLSELEDKFGLSYDIDIDIDIVNATGIKKYYYSTCKTAENIGYIPCNTSISGLTNEVGVIVKKMKVKNNQI